jgi:hypothetical protein
MGSLLASLRKGRVGALLRASGRLGDGVAARVEIGPGDLAERVAMLCSSAIPGIGPRLP